MKTKRIVALALTAAMAVSMASMTAFAADKTWGDYEAKGADAIVVKDDGNYKETYEGYVLHYTINGGSDKLYTYRKGSTYKHETADPNDTTQTNTKETVSYELNTSDETQTGAEKAGLLFKNLKALGGFGDIGTEDEDNAVFMGWSLENTANSTITAAADSDKTADALKVLKDGDDIFDLINAGTIPEDGTKGKALKFVPVFRKKTAAEWLQSQVNIANRAKVAKPVGEKDWVYTQKDLDRSTARVSAPLGEDSSASSLKKCNAEMRHSRVYEIKPAVQKDGDDKVVELKKGATEKVQIKIKTLYKDSEIDSDSKINTLISKGKLKVFHIGSDGKSRQVTGIKAGKDADNDPCVEFKCGSFSEFVITKDPNARAQAGEEDGASGGNPATGEASTLPVAMLALAALSATGIVAYKKRKAE